MCTHSNITSEAWLREQNESCDANRSESWEYALICEVVSGAVMLSIRVASVVLQRRCTLIPAQSPTSLMGVLGSCKGADHNLHLTLTSPQTPFVVIKRPASTFFSRSRKLNTLARLHSASAYRHHRVVNGYIAWFDSLSWVYVDFNHNGLANLTTRHDTISGP